MPSEYPQSMPCALGSSQDGGFVLEAASQSMFIVGRPRRTQAEKQLMRVVPTFPTATCRKEPNNLLCQSLDAVLSGRGGGAIANIALHTFMQKPEGLIERPLT